MAWIAQVDGIVRSTKIGHGLVALLFAASVALPRPAVAQQSGGVASPVPLRIAAGPVSQPMFAAAAIIANIISNPPGGPACPPDAGCGPAGLVGEARSMPSSVANLESLAIGESETAFVEGDLAWQAHGGFGGFAGRPFGDLRALAVLYTQTVFVVVRAAAPIQSIADLQGRTVALSQLRDAHLATVGAILAGHGVRERDMTLIHLSLDNAAAALRHGEVDAAVMLAPALPQAFREVAETTALRLLPVEAAAAKTLLQQQPYLIEVEIGDLAEGRRRTPGLALPVLWLTTQRLPANIAYGLLRALQAPANAQAVAQALPQSSALADRNDLARSPIPLHIGAARWSEETSGVVR